MEPKHDERRGETRIGLLMMEQNRKKIYFASDAHLGARFHKNSIEAERKLTRWLESIRKDAAAVYFLGDMFDFWYEYKYVVPKGFTRFLGKVAEMADEGIEIHFFIGNHDVWMFDYLPKEVGAIIHRDVLTVNLMGKNFFLGHGDEMDFTSKGFRLIRWIFRNKICQVLYEAIHPRWTSGFALGWSLSSRKKGLKHKSATEYKGEDKEFQIIFAKEYLKEHPDINFFIFGHRHIMLNLMLTKSCRILISGDWMQHFSYIVWDGENISLEQFHQATNQTNNQANT